MQVLIENYRGWEIFFDTDQENFYSTAEEYDYEMTKKSYSSSKKAIDDFIKDNQKFTHVWVQTMDGEPRKLVGIRKDGRFVYEDSEGKRRQIESYYEDNYFLVNEDNDKFFKKIKELKDEIALNNRTIREIQDKLVKVGLDTLKEKYKNLMG